MSPSLMAATRRGPPLEIYQDQDASAGGNADHDVETALLNALRPLNDASNKQNVQLNPSTTSQPGSSPTKTDSSPLRPVSAHGLPDLKIPPPRQPNFKTNSPQKDGGFYSMYHEMAPMPDKALFTHFPSTQAQDKENYYESATLGGMSTLPYEDAEYGYKGPMKRHLMDAMPRSVKKQRVETEEPFDLPDPKHMPSVVDDGTKPPHSYAELIGMAILRAPNRRLTLAQIYSWISDNFAFYKTVETGWQNSIRHNLSLNKNFIKQERPKDDPGKGNYWLIKSGEERPFLLGKKNPIRRITYPDGSQYMHGLPSDMGGYRPSSAPAISQFTLAPNPVKRMDSKAIDSAKFPDEAEFSSDGTIPASDPARMDEDKDDHAAMPPPSTHFRSSPPPEEIGSSPPAVAVERKSTPPPVPRFPSTSRSGGRRRKFAGLNDSGYWSSIESSAARGAAQLLTSESDLGRSRIKKGRAEAEIARIRSSSIDSPSKDATRVKPATSHFGSSPPAKDDNPLTPAVVFKRPAKPPPSVSPNTNLRNHRNRMRALLGSPAKAFSPLPEASTWSPAFNMAEDGSVGLTPYISPYKNSKTPWKPSIDTPSNSHFYNSAFDIFIDAPEDDLQARGSPEKRSARRPSLARAATSTGILADITGAAKSNNLTLPPSDNNAFSFSPFLAKSGTLRSPAKLGSPLKQDHRPTSHHAATDLNWLDIGLGAENTQPSHANTTNADAASELFGVDLPSDGSEEAIDIFQDFGKIGQQQQQQHPSSSLFFPTADRANGSPVRKTTNMGPPPARPARPNFGRSNTSRW